VVVMLELVRILVVADMAGGSIVGVVHGGVGSGERDTSMGI
jgi:hypothetical protein